MFTSCLQVVYPPTGKQNENSWFEINKFEQFTSEYANFIKVYSFFPFRFNNRPARLKFKIVPIPIQFYGEKVINARFAIDAFKYPIISSNTSHNYRLSGDVRKTFCTFAHIIVIVVIVVIAHLFGQIWDIFILEWQQTIDYRSIFGGHWISENIASTYISGDYHSTVNIINTSYLLIHLLIFLIIKQTRTFGNENILWIFQAYSLRLVFRRQSNVFVYHVLCAGMHEQIQFKSH